MNAPDAAELTAKEYQKLIDAGKLQYIGAKEDSLAVFHVYRVKDKDVFVIFSAKGTLTSVWVEGNERRSWQRIMDWIGLLPSLGNGI